MAFTPLHHMRTHQPGQRQFTRMATAGMIYL